MHGVGNITRSSVGALGRFASFAEDYLTQLSQFRLPLRFEIMTTYFLFLMVRPVQDTHNYYYRSTTDALSKDKVELLYDLNPTQCLAVTSLQDMALYKLVSVPLVVLQHALPFVRARVSSLTEGTSTAGVPGAHEFLASPSATS